MLHIIQSTRCSVTEYCRLQLECCDLSELNLLSVKCNKRLSYKNVCVAVFSVICWKQSHGSIVLISDAICAGSRRGGRPSLSFATLVIV